MHKDYWSAKRRDAIVAVIGLACLLAVILGLIAVALNLIGE